MKDVLDGLQGAFFDKGSGKLRAKDWIIKSHASVCRVVVEKQEVPKKYKNRTEKAPGGRLPVRPFKEWPFELRSKDP